MGHIDNFLPRVTAWVVLLISTFALLSTTANAAQRFWTGGGGVANGWTTAANWQGNVAPVANDDLLFPTGVVNKTANNNSAANTVFRSLTIGDNGYNLTGNAITLGSVGIQYDNVSLFFSTSTIALPMTLPAQRQITFTGTKSSQLILSGAITGVGSLQIVSIPGVDPISGIVTFTGVGNTFSGGINLLTSSISSTVSGGFGTGPIAMLDGQCGVYLSALLSHANALNAQGGGFSGNGALGGAGTWSGPISVTNFTGLGSNSSPELVISGALTGAANAVVNAPQNGVASVVTLSSDSPAFFGILNPNPGTLNVNAIFANASADLSSSFAGTTLAGTGSIGGAVKIGALTHLAPGYKTTTGVLGTGNLLLQSPSAALDIRLGGSVAGVGYSQVNVTGTVTLGGTLNMILQPGYTPPVGTSYTIIKNDGNDAVIDTFFGLPEGAKFIASGTPFGISYIGGTGNDVVITAQSFSLAVATTGSGIGNVTGTGANPINCGNGGLTCLQSPPTGTLITLTATPAANHTFVGWKGAGCLLTNPCDVLINDSYAVQAYFAPTAKGPFNFDIDNNSPNSPGLRRPASDGMMILRYLLGYRGAAITTDVMGNLPGRAAGLIPAYLADIYPLLDVDGNGEIDAATDGLLIMRAMLGVTGNALVTGAVGPNATRNTAAIEAYIAARLPL
jgi:hypothetical protein